MREHLERGPSFNIAQDLFDKEVERIIEEVAEEVIDETATQ